MTKFTRLILSALAEVPPGYSQRIDGLRCERSIIEEAFPFFGFRLWLLCRAGLIAKTHIHHSIFPSADGLPFFHLTDAGRAAIEAAS